MDELASFDPAMLEKPMIVVASKVDVAQDPSRIENLRALAAEKGLPFFEISSVTGQGIEALKFAMAEAIVQPEEEIAKLIPLEVEELNEESTND